MNKIILLLLTIAFPAIANSAVCKQIRAIEGFSSAPLFDNAIINNKPLDYYSFSSDCDTGCLARRFKRSDIRYRFAGSNISVFDKDSVATLIIDSQYKQSIAGYMTCSSTAKRSYIRNPININTKKVSLDLQTEDYRHITRTINLQGYSRREYAQVISQLNKLTGNKESIVGFINYRLTRPRQTIKVSALSPRGDFMLIIEKAK